ncbi:hypothetical protein MKW98_024486, partial [Papaver atlanticum]
LLPICFGYGCYSVYTNEIIEAKLQGIFWQNYKIYLIIQGLTIEREAAAFTPESDGASEQIGLDFDPECSPFHEEHK